ncbi:MAG TPA: M15 family metallopeptidase [Actinomycetota bacterium]|nr:M15 family metallopeptidase [Actinomycetota bacterium]
MSSARRPPERPPGRSPQPSRATNGGGNGRVHVTNRGWAALVGLVVVVALLAGWAMFRGGSGKPGAQGTTAATGGISTTSPSTTPASSDTTDPSPGVEALPACAYSVLPAPDAKLGQWRQTLLDTTFALPGDYTPPDLVSVSQAGSAAGELVRSFVIPDLEALLRASDAAGTPVDVLIGYRSFARQQALFQDHVRQFGHKEALAKTARPGHSEHQLGTTIDFRTKGQVDVPQDWESQPAGAWMVENAWKFGFVMSYPRGREDVTCYAYEPWHYRYVGRTMAERIHASGLTPREFLWQIDSSDEPTPRGTTAP